MDLEVLGVLEVYKLVREEPGRSLSTFSDREGKERVSELVEGDRGPRGLVLRDDLGEGLLAWTLAEWVRLGDLAGEVGLEGACWVITSSNDYWGGAGAISLPLSSPYVWSIMSSLSSPLISFSSSLAFMFRNQFHLTSKGAQAFNPLPSFNLPSISQAYQEHDRVLSHSILTLDQY